MLLIRLFIILLLFPAINSYAYEPKAKQIQNEPAGDILSTNVQDAINELDTEKLSLIYGIKIVTLKPVVEAATLTTGDGKIYWVVPAEMTGWNLISVGAHVFTASTSGLPNIQIRNNTDSVDMLSTAITIDANEFDSKDATIAAVIDITKDDIATGDEIRIDVDGAGTNTKGLEVRMAFRMP